MEREVEKLKCELVQRPDFTCSLAYDLLDFCRRGELSKIQFAESLYSLIGHELYNRNQSFLLFSRYDEDKDGKLTYREFSRMLLPVDRALAAALTKRYNSAASMSQETKDLFIRLLKAHLNTAQAQEYIRERFVKRLAIEGWRLEDLFSIADTQGNGSLRMYDVERLIMEYRKCGSVTLMEDVELLFAMYDKQGLCRINFFDFKDQLIPFIQ